MLSLDSDPLQTGGEEFLFRIDSHHVCAEGPDAAVGTESDLWHEAGVVFVESLERGDQALAAEIFAAELECVDEDLRGGHR